MFERRQFGNSQRRVLFFIGGYRTSIKMYAPAYWLMRLLGYRVYAYVLDSQTVVSSNIMAYVGQIEAVQRDIAQTLQQLPHGIPAYTMGNSLGSESALYALKHTPQLRAAALVTVRGSIARFIWKSSAGRSFKPAYEHNGYDYTQLSQELSPAEPIKDLELIGSRPVYVWYSQADKIIPSSNTRLLLQALTKTGVQLRVRNYKHLGHFMSAFASIGAFWRWHRFFRQS